MIMTLGELIKKLEQYKPNAHVYFDFANAVPLDFHLYRVYSDELCLTYKPLLMNEPEILVKDFLALCKNIIGKTLKGDYEDEKLIVNEFADIQITSDPTVFTQTALIDTQSDEDGYAVYLITHTEIEL